MLAQRVCNCVNRYCRHHRALRQKLTPAVLAGKTKCWRCKKTIKPGQPWDLGHDDEDPNVYRGPEHVACNRATVGRGKHAPLRWKL